MSGAEIPTIELDHGGPRPVVVDMPGRRQVTPPGKADRYYLDLALSDGRWEATGQRFTSVTAILGRGIPTDWTGPAKWNVARGAVESWDALAAMPADQRVRTMVDFAGASLDAAADRGSAIHRAVEALLLGCPVDRDDLDAAGAMPWLLAVERFVADAQPVAHLLEATCFDRDLGVAGTVDFVGTLAGCDDVLVLDWKTRTKGHDRRPKEAAQVGAYAAMVEDHYYIDARGQRRQMPVHGAGVVTFAPDGTWALHRVHLHEAVEHYRAAVAMAQSNRVAALYQGAECSEAPDINALASERIARVPDGSPERAQLVAAWTMHGLGRPSEGELDAQDWPVVDALLARAEQAFAPFPEARTAETAFADAAAIAEVLDELAKMPADIVADVRRANEPAFRRAASAVVTVAELEDVERLVGVAADRVAMRRYEVDNLLGQIDPDLVPLLDVPVGHWTETDIERVATLWHGHETGALVVRGGELAPSVVAMENLAAAGKTDARMAAKPHAETLGRPTPKNWGDLVSDPLLFAAVCGVEHTTTQHESES